MGDQDQDGSASKKKKTRGAYKAWLEKPGAQPPRSTSRNRRMRQGNQGIMENPGQAVDQNDTAAEGDVSADQPTGSFESDASADLDQPTGALLGSSHFEQQQDDADVIRRHTRDLLCVGVCVCGSCPTDPAELPLHQPPISSSDQPQTEERSAIDGAPSADHPPKRSERIKWDECFLPFLPTTTFEVFLMVLHMTFRHSGMTGPLIEDILKFVNMIAGKPVIPETEYYIKKLFKPKGTMQIHFYCEACGFYLGSLADFSEATSDCDQCGKSSNVRELSGNFFVTMSVKQELENILAQPDLTFVSRDGRPDGVYSDVVDGDMYKELCQPGGLLSDENSLTLTFNTDGARIFQNSEGSLWPVQAIVNELDLGIRFKRSNVLVCGLWFGKGSPNMTAFLKPFKEEMNLLGSSGVCRSTSNGDVVNCPVFALLCSADSIAIPKIVRRKQFNGRCGCGYCLHPNLPVLALTTINNLRYVAVGEDGSFLSYPYRTHEGMLADMMKAHGHDVSGLLGGRVAGEDLPDHFNGVKGLSILADLGGFNLVYGFPIDYLHQMCEGVPETFLSIVCAGPSKSRQYWKNEEYRVAVADERICSATPPTMMCVEPKPVSNRSKWKGKDYRMFLLYLFVPIFADLLAERYFQNFKKFASASYILLSDKIAREELVTAANLMQEFVHEFNVLYGSSAITYNIHLCTHLAVIVKCWGPLPNYSTFVFESGNGYLKKLVNGTNGVVTQIARKHLTIQSVSSVISEHENVSDRVLKFCSEIMSHQYVKKTTKFDDGRAFGLERVSKLNDLERAALAEVGVVLPSEQVSFFNRATKDGVVYYCKAYTRPACFDNTCVTLADNTFAVIEKFVRIPGASELHMFIKPIRIADEEPIAPHVLSCAFDLFAPLKVTTMSNIKRLCARVTVKAGNYERNFITVLPNVHERD